MIHPSKKLAIDTIERKKTKGIPTFLVHIMDIPLIEELAQVPPGTYEKEPEKTYLKYVWNIGINCLDQFIPDNPLSMTHKGFDEKTKKGPTTGLKNFILDGVVIDSPESVVLHMEKFFIPSLKKSIEQFDEEQTVKSIIDQENTIQEKLGETVLKSGYGYIRFPTLSYGHYGYENYFMAYLLYPDIIEKVFSLQADYAELHNKAAARAIVEGNLPLLYRLDHDMADSRGLLVSMKSLEKIWLPHFYRAIQPVLKTNINLIWHCDGNLMEMIPYLIDCGIKGFQGFQYEAGMDYVKICKMKAKDGDSLIIVAGVSVTTVLPHGTPEEVRQHMNFLVENGPETGLFLAGSSSITPGTNRENVLTFIEGLKYYREQGRK
ncbi:MAG: hypothetical protein NC906_07655 [Candidatus Omnitrophica bacterium]|nr:hypothetical protein [Candidatus Omnitrophota bacterium]